MKRLDGTWEIFDDYVIDFALDRMRDGERVAIVTLVKIEGSSPRPLGAQMAVSESGNWVGYLSGGCIERAIVNEALAAMELGKSRLVRYGRGSDFIDIQLPCGSAIELFFDVDRTQHELTAIDESLHRRQSGRMSICDKSLGHFAEPIVRSYQPRRRLIVAGIGPVAIQLAKLARLASFDVRLHSPDTGTRAAVQDNDIGTITIASTAEVPNFSADRRSAIVFAFHDHEWERSLIPAALHTNAFYIGAMGSRQTHQRRLRMLREDGVDPLLLCRIHGPAGLFSGGKTAPDIAMSILAEVMQVARNKDIPDIEFVQSGRSASADLRNGIPLSRDGNVRRA